MDKRKVQEKVLIFGDDLQVIPNIYDLEKLGAGHDGKVFRFKDKAVKLLKYDINERKEKGLMTFQKAVYFKEELSLKRIIKPMDILLDEDGIYSAYVMDYLIDITSEKFKGTPIYKESGDFTCEELIMANHELIDDFTELTKKGVIAKDINRGSYIYSHDFMHLCDMDKYECDANSHGLDDLNKQALNFTIAKYLYYEIRKLKNLDKQQLKALSKWVKKCSNSRTFLSELEREIGTNYSAPVREFVEYKAGKIL